MDITLSKILIWLATGGSVLAVSYACESWGLFHKLQPLAKRFAMWGSASFLGVSAWAVTTYVDPAVLTVVGQALQPAIVAFVLVFLQEKFHQKTKTINPEG